MISELTLSDFPGELNRGQKQAAQRIISKFNKQRESFPFEVAKKIVVLAKDGLPHWKKAVTSSPVPHKYYRNMHGPESKLKQRRLCWEKWWVLAAIYGHTHPRLWPATLEFRRRLKLDDANNDMVGMQYPGPIPAYESNDSSDEDEESGGDGDREMEDLFAPVSQIQVSEDVGGDGSDHNSEERKRDEWSENNECNEQKDDSSALNHEKSDSLTMIKPSASVIETEDAYGITRSDLIRRLFSAETRILAIENSRKKEDEHRRALASRISALETTMADIQEDQQALKPLLSTLETREEGFKELLRAIDKVEGNVEAMNKAVGNLKALAASAGSN